MTERINNVEKILERITPEKMQDLTYLTLVKEYWKANYFQLKDWGAVTYVFWMKTEVPYLMDDITVYFEVRKDELIPHLIHNQAPNLDLRESLILIGTPTQFSSLENLDTIRLIKNITPIQKHNIANVFGYIIQILGQVSKRMDEGFEVSLDPQTNVMVQEKSRFFQKKVENTESEKPALREKPTIHEKISPPSLSSSSKGLRFDIPIYGRKQNAIPPGRYETPKNEIQYSEEAYDFSEKPPNLSLNFDFHKKIPKDKPLAEIMSSNRKVVMSFPCLGTFTHYIQSTIQIFQQEPEFPANISLRDLIDLSKAMITLLNPELAKKFPENTWKKSILLLQSHEIINSKIRPPHLTKKGLILREVLLLGQEVNQEFFFKIPEGLTNSLHELILSEIEPNSISFGDQKIPTIIMGDDKKKMYSPSSASGQYQNPQSPNPIGICCCIITVIFFLSFLFG